MIWSSNHRNSSVITDMPFFDFSNIFDRKRLLVPLIYGRTTINVQDTLEYNHTKNITSQKRQHVCYRDSKFHWMNNEGTLKNKQHARGTIEPRLSKGKSNGAIRRRRT